MMNRLLVTVAPGLLLAAALALVAASAQAQTGRVITAAPTYTTGTTAPLSLQTDGDLRVYDEDNGTLFGNMSTSLQLLDNAIPTGNEFQVDVLTLLGGATAHDAAGAAILPLPVGGYASAAAPTDVSADADIVRAWYLRNGAQATVLTAGGALIGGDATNGLDVDVTRQSALVTGSAIIGSVMIDQTTPGTTNNVFVASSANTIAKAEDLASATAHVGVPAMAVRTATPANTSTTEGDYEFLQMSAGRLWTSTTLAANSGVDIGDVTLTANSGVDIGDVTLTANDGVDIGNVDVASSVLPPGAATETTAADIAAAVRETLEVKILDSLDNALDYTAPASSTVASVVDDDSPAQVCLDSDPTRQGAAFFNDSGAYAYLLVDEGTASATNFTIKMDPGGYYELTVLANGVYTDAISCIWSADGSGSMRVTEWLP